MPENKPIDCEIIGFAATDKRRDGSELLTSTGQKMWKVQLRIAKRPDVWINGLIFKDPGESWVGSTRPLILFTEDYNGEPQPKFKLPPTKKPPAGAAQTEMLEKLLAAAAAQLEATVVQTHAIQEQTEIMKEISSMNLTIENHMRVLIDFARNKNE